MRNTWWRVGGSTAALSAALALGLGCEATDPAPASPPDAAPDGAPAPDTDTPVADAGADATVPGDAEASRRPWSEASSEDHIAILWHDRGLGPAYDVAWDGESHLLHCGRGGVQRIEAIHGGATEVPGTADCARIVATAEGTLMTTAAGAVQELEGASATPLADAGAHPVRAALRAQGAVFAAAEGSGLLRWDGAAWETVDGAFDGHDLAHVVRDGQEGLLVATSDGVRWYTLSGGQATPSGSATVAGGAWRVAARDGAAHDGPLLVAGPRGVMRASSAGPLELLGAEETRVRVAPVDVAPLGECGLAAGWPVLTRVACGEPGVPLDQQALPAASMPDAAVDHVSAVAVSAEGRVAAGTRLGLARLDVLPDPARAPQLYLPRRVLQFVSTPPGASAVVGFRVANDGDQPLLIESVEIDDPRFEVDINPLFAGEVATWDPEPVLAISPRMVPGFFEVRFHSDTTEEVRASMTIASNDPDRPELVVPLVANRVNIGVGEATRAVFLPDVRGRFHELATLADLDRVTYYKLFNST